jgi:hypothetical protein
MEEFPGNSHKNTNPKVDKKAPGKKAAQPKIGEEKEKLKKVVSGEVITKKPPLLHRVKTSFITGELSGVARYIGNEVLLPALRNLIVDSTTQGIERMIYGERSPRGSRPSQSNRGNFQYNNPVQRGTRPYPGQSRPVSTVKRRRSSEDIILASHEEAVDVLETMGAALEKYGRVSQADLYDLIGFKHTYVDNEWGWTSLAYASVRQVREGFILDLPDPESLSE